MARKSALKTRPSRKALNVHFPSREKAINDAPTPSFALVKIFQYIQLLNCLFCAGSSRFKAFEIILSAEQITEFAVR